MARTTNRRARRDRSTVQVDASHSHIASNPPGPVAIVVATPSDAIALLAAEPEGAVVEIVCLQDGREGEYRALEQAIGDARKRGCVFPGEPFVLDAEVGNVTRLVVDALHEIQPLRVRTLDPDPRHTSVDKERRELVVTEPKPRGTAARGAIAAARQFQRESGRPVFVECHRAESDPRFGFDACSRYPRPAHWLTRDRAGRLTAYLVSAAGVLRWTEAEREADGWLGPELLDTPELMPGLTVLQGPEGYVHLIGLRRAKRKEGGGADVEVVHATQYQSGRPIGPWHSVGNPNAGDWKKAREVGFPVAAFDAKGTLHFFVRNVGKSISTRRQDTAGSWSKWEHLGGRRVADELVAYPGWHGGVEVMATAADGGAAVRWFYDVEAKSWTEDRGAPVSPYPGSLSAGPEAGVVRYRYAATNEVCVWPVGTAAPLGLGGADGAGRIAAVTGADIQGWGCTVLVRSGPHGESAIGAHPDGRPENGVWWTQSGERSLVPPATAVDRRGRVAIVTLGEGGRLWVARQQLGSGGLEFTPWSAV
ncbi:hypothetical protein [Streptomyces sp. NPDC006879]|uniref:hypothetical protein n=1 Tax=Streptomyces sp. NPDC006879 TaxID=3364767 RepID=UPI003680BEDB